MCDRVNKRFEGGYLLADDITADNRMLLRDYSDITEAHFGTEQILSEIL